RAHRGRVGAPHRRQLARRAGAGDRHGADAGDRRTRDRAARGVALDRDRDPPPRRLPGPVVPGRPAQCARRQRSRARAAERGTMTIFLLGTAVAILFLGGLVVDFWRVIAARRELAAMADSAATAGANGLDDTSLRTGGAALDPAQARSLALAQ